MSDQVTRLLHDMQQGDSAAADRLVPIVYRELRRIAAALMRSERADHTLQPTAVVHEALLRLMEGEPVSFENRSHFFALAARIMRRLLVDHARRRIAGKRGGEGMQQIEMEEGLALTAEQSNDVLALHARRATGAHRRDALLCRQFGRRDRLGCRCQRSHGETRAPDGAAVLASAAAVARDDAPIAESTHLSSRLAPDHDSDVGPRF